MHLVRFLLAFYIIFEYSSCEKIWHSNYLDVSSKSRNDFVLNDISLEGNFSLNISINFWKSINFKHVSYVVGISDDKMVILNITEDEEAGRLLINSQNHELSEKYVDAGIGKDGNNFFVITATPEGSIDWYNMTDGSKFWSWNTGFQTKTIKIDTNTISKRPQLFIGLQNDVVIYEFDIETKKKWLVERIEFREEVGLFDTILHRKNFYLLIPTRKSGKLSIYSYSKVEHKFELFQTLNSPETDQVVTFQYNFKSFFAVNGLDAKIYQMSRKHQIFQENVLNSHLEGVKHWLPVKLNNLRGNVALFGQRFLEHGSHNTSIMDIFTYHENHFEKHEDLPCHLFGEKLNSIDCFFAKNHDNSIGFDKAAYISSRNYLGVLIPGNQEHKLFLVHFTSRFIESPIRMEIEKLNQLMGDLEKLLNEKLEQSAIEELDSAPQKFSAENPTSNSRTSAAGNLISPKFMSRNNIKNDEQVSEKLDEILEDLHKIKHEIAQKRIVIKGDVGVQKISVQEITSNTIFGESTNQVLEDIVNSKNDKIVKGTKTFTDLQVENLNFEFVNGIEASDLTFKAPEIKLNANINFEQPILVAENLNANFINNIPASSIIFTDNLERIPGTLSFENLSVEQLEAGELNKIPSNEFMVTPNFGSLDSVFIPHNLTVETINGDDFEKILEELCLVNIETHIPGTILVFGDVVVEKSADIEFLNTLKFPEEYFFTDNFGGVSVSGQKTFGSLKADGIRTDGQFVNGIKTSDIFTTSTPQEIPSKFTFKSLEVTEKFEHDGKTFGDRIDKFLPNPTMLETQLIKSNVNFADLEVTGSIIIEENFNTENYEETLKDIVYKDEENPSINSIKEFAEGLTVRKQLNITSNSINLIPIDQIVTKDTNQILSIPRLNGDLSVENMFVKQLINGVNITKLDAETAKISGEQFISSVLVFKDNLEVNELEIEEKLNENFVNEYLTTSEELLIDSPVQFSEIEAETLVVNGNFSGNISGFDLENFAKNRMTYSTAQNIESDFFIENMKIENLKCDNINGEKCETVIMENPTESILNRISDGSVKVKKLICDQELEIEKLNGISLSEPTDLHDDSVIIKGNVYFPHLDIENLSEVNFQKFLNNVIFKNETNVELSGFKTFQQPLTIQKLIETEKLNSVPIENLLTKEGDQIINAPIEIYGNVTFPNELNIDGTINGISMEDLKSYLEMDDETYVIKGDVMFDRLSYIENLEVNGEVNGKNLEEVLKNLIYDDGQSEVSNKVEFLEKVTIEGDVEIKENLNDIDLSELNENVVYIGKVDNNGILGPVTFTQPDIFAENLVVETDLTTETLYGIKLEELLKDAVFLNKGLLKGNFSFENVKIHEILSTKMINNVDLSQTIPLGTNQFIPKLNFESVHFINDVSVKNLVNNLNLSAEYEKSVLSDKEQEILSDVRFTNNTLIRDKLEVAGNLNNLPIHKIVTVDTDQNLTALYNLSSKIVLESNLQVDGFVNSINMTKWEYGTVKMISQEPQEIEAPWHISGNLTFQDDLHANIYNFDINKEMEIMNQQKLTKNALELQFIQDQKEICKDIKFLSREMRKQIYKFDALELIHELEYENYIGKSIHFVSGNQTFLLVNGQKSCESTIFMFDNTKFTRISSIELGEIDQIIKIEQSGHSVVFIVKNEIDTKCSSVGTNVWKLHQNFTVQKIQNIEHQHQLQESQVPSTFYGLNKQGITEFRIDEERVIPVFPYRKWKITEDNMAFVPRGLGTGLAVRTGKKLIKLLRNDPILENNDIGFDSFLRGETETTQNLVLPGKSNSELEVLKVGSGRMKKTMLAVVFFEDTIVETHLDVIKIYQDYTDDKLFQIIPTYNPTSMTSLVFPNGETLLLVLENFEKLQVYEYKGNEGFKRRLSADFPEAEMFKMKLEDSEVICVIYKNKISLIEPVMLGNFYNVKNVC